MGFRLVDLADVVTIPAPNELTAEEELTILSQYQSERTLDRLEADYRDIEQQIAEGISAEELLLALTRQDASGEN